MTVLLHRASDLPPGREGEKLEPLTWRKPIPFDYENIPKPLKAQYLKDLALCTCAFGHECRMVSDVHTIAADGTVSPSYVCPVKGCTFHVHVRLDGWTP